jgi:hypothetical protein
MLSAATATANSQATQLATWLVVGNAGALVLCLQGLKDNDRCVRLALEMAANRFALGLALAFGAGFFTYFLWIGAVAWMTGRLAASSIIAYAHEIEAEGSEIEDGSILAGHRDKAGATLNDKRGAYLVGIGSLIALSVYVASGAGFAQGVLATLRAIPACAPPTTVVAQNVRGTDGVKPLVTPPAQK